MSNFTPWALSNWPALCASATPLSLRSGSFHPVNRLSLFHSLSPWRTNTSTLSIPILCPARCRSWSGLGTVNAQHIHHIEHAGALAPPPQRGFDGPARIDPPISSAMDQLDPFTVGGKNDRVVTDDAATAQDQKTDIAAPALAGVAVARARTDLLKLDFAALGSGAAQHQGRTRRRVDLVAMMHLEHLDIEVGVERLGDLAHQGAHEVDAEAHVAG